MHFYWLPLSRHHKWNDTQWIGQPPPSYSFIWLSSWIFILLAHTPPAPSASIYVTFWPSATGCCLHVLFFLFARVCIMILCSRCGILLSGFRVITSSCFIVLEARRPGIISLFRFWLVIRPCVVRASLSCAFSSGGLVLCPAIMICLLAPASVTTWSPAGTSRPPTWSACAPPPTSSIPSLSPPTPASTSQPPAPSVAQLPSTSDGTPPPSAKSASSSPPNYSWQMSHTPSLSN